jgi:hypothetical protein
MVVDSLITDWNTMPLTLDGVPKHAICVKYLSGRTYVFRYAYDTPGRAQQVMHKLRYDLGRPHGIDADIATNYWRLTYHLRTKAKFAKTVAPNGGWYICANAFL